MRIPTAVRLALALLPACTKGAPAEPHADSKGSTTPSSKDAPPGSARGAPPPPPAFDAALFPGTPSREPDMGLALEDPAKDYVTRYILATKRYGDPARCIVVAPSVTTRGTTTVDVRNHPSGACGPANQVRDTFMVDVAADRLRLQDPSHHAPLAKWPDASDPEGPAAPVRDTDDIRAWKDSVKDTMVALKLTPIRLQWYGRGTYPIVTLAGWHDPLLHPGTPEALIGAAKKFCGANGNQSFGVFAGVDRVNLLRMVCPEGAAWERF